MYKLILLVASTLLAVHAVAGGDKTKDATKAEATIAFEALDKNGDQQISKTEAAAEKQLVSNFAAVDSNGDGYISKAEYAAARSRS